MKLLQDKICLVTGANRGIGKVVVEQYASLGAIVFANAREKGCMDKATKELERKYDTTIIPVYFDVRDTVEIRKVIQRIQKEYKKLDVLVNNAGIMKDALIGMISDEMMKEVFETNVFASINLMQYASRLMKRNSSGSIINFTSIVGVYGAKGQLTYSASKGAVIAMTKAAAKELAADHIRVNAVAPGMIDTDMLYSIGQERMNVNLANIGMGRFGTPEDIAKACVFFASDFSEYITGQVLGIDGGMMI